MKTRIDMLRSEGKYLSSAKEKANALNKQFAFVFSAPELKMAKRQRLHTRTLLCSTSQSVKKEFSNYSRT